MCHQRTYLASGEGLLLLTQLPVALPANLACAAAPAAEATWLSYYAQKVQVVTASIRVPVQRDSLCSPGFLAGHPLAAGCVLMQIFPAAIAETYVAWQPGPWSA